MSETFVSFVCFVVQTIFAYLVAA